MRVLLVNMTIDPVVGGGTAAKSVQIARALRSVGQEVGILTTEVPSRIRQELEGVQLITLPLLSRRFWIPLPVPGRIRRAVDRSDVVVLSNHWSVLNLLVGRKARRLGKPYVVIPSGALARFGRSLTFKKLFNRFGGRSLISAATGHIATTEDEVEHFLAYGISPERVHVIPNAVVGEPGASDAGTFRARYRIDRPFILFLGRLSPIKGPDLLLEAFARVADRIPHQIVFAGTDDGMQAMLESATHERKIAERVRFVGFLSGGMKQSALAGAALLVIPSRQEAMSLVALEAAQYGVPVVASDRCGLNGLADKGLLTTAAVSAEALASAVQEVLSRQDAGRRMGARLRAHVEENYSWDAVVCRYLDVLTASSEACSGSGEG
jgi:glycosyltransferase involved in cell wall biosynthesis